MSAPLYERVPVKNAHWRAIQLLNLLLLLCLLAYRLLLLGANIIDGSVPPAWILVAFLCESWFTFIFLLSVNLKWNPVEYRTYPQRLLQQFPELPAVDLFVTTADPTLEPPIMTVNTVLSLLSVDYPAHKLACYVSDDGASAITFYSLVQAFEFSKSWVPFCKKYSVELRDPAAYFSCTEPVQLPPQVNSSHFFDQWRENKQGYDALRRKIEKAADGLADLELNKDYAVFSKIERGNHSSIIKVIWENKENHPEAIPHLAYVAREKRPKSPHHYKAGAMNVLTRVSGVMTNAPFILNVDCDMKVNNPQVILHAMCLLLGARSERETGFVQTPQLFYGALKDDPFGNQFYVAQNFTFRGMSGLQGPVYGGTGCVHRRKIIYGQPPEAGATTEKVLHQDHIKRKMGHSEQFATTVARMLSQRGRSDEGAVNNSAIFSGNNIVEAAIEVSNCSYEINTCWGDEIGWVYGSATEDVLTGLKIHSMGWRSAYLTPDPPAFIGCAPPAGPASLVQMKRWTTGMLEIFFTRYNPLLAALTEKLELRQALCYLTFLMWAPRSIPEMFYSLLPAYCLLSNKTFLPKITEPAMVIPMGIFAVTQLYGLSEFISCSQSIRAWWNTQRMSRIMSSTSGLFGILSVLLKLVGVSETLFEVTPKTQSNTEADSGGAGGTREGRSGWFKFDNSTIFVPGLGLLFVHVVAFSVGLWKLTMRSRPGSGWEEDQVVGVGEMVCSAWLMLCFLPFVKGLFRKGSYGIPWHIIVKASGLAFIVVSICLTN